MRWSTTTDDHMPLWLWALIPLWGPALFLFIVLIEAVKTKRRLIGPRDEWSAWFAWHPVEISFEERAWLEWVERKSVHIMGDTHYRPLSSHPSNTTTEGEDAHG